MIVGYAHLKPIGDGYDLIYIGVRKEQRRRGIARKMLDKLISFTSEKPIMLEVRKSNAAAIKLYESAGFKVISEREKYYSDGEDAWIMKR